MYWTQFQLERPNSKVRKSEEKKLEIELRASVLTSLLNARTSAGCPSDASAGARTSAIGVGCRTSALTPATGVALFLLIS